MNPPEVPRTRATQGPAACADILLYTLRHETFALKADDLVRVLSYAQACEVLGEDRVANAMDVDRLLCEEVPPSERRVVLTRAPEIIGLLRGRLTMARISGSEILPLPPWIKAATAKRGVIGVTVTALGPCLLISLLALGKQEIV